MTKTAVNCCRYLLFNERTSYRCSRSKLAYLMPAWVLLMLLQGQVALDLGAKQPLLGQIQKVNIGMTDAIVLHSPNTSI